jgi:hypothetical protein
VHLNDFEMINKKNGLITKGGEHHDVNEMSAID